MSQERPFSRGTPIMFRCPREYAGQTGRVTHFHGDPGYVNSEHADDEVWVDFDDPKASNEWTGNPVGEGIWAGINEIEVHIVHDGDLGEDRYVEHVREVWSESDGEDVPGIGLGMPGDYYYLTAAQALSLLEWLRQNEATLRERAKEVSG